MWPGHVERPDGPRAGGRPTPPERRRSGCTPLGWLLFENELARIVRDAVHAHFVMQVGPGAAAGVAHRSDELATLHLLAQLDVDALQVSVARLQPVAVVEHEDVAIAAFRPSEHHRAVRG